MINIIASKPRLKTDVDKNRAIPQAAPPIRSHNLCFVFICCRVNTKASVPMLIAGLMGTIVVAASARNEVAVARRITVARATFIPSKVRVMMDVFTSKRRPNIKKTSRKSVGDRPSRPSQAISHTKEGLSIVKIWV
jgi:hypothetical protein